MPFPKSTLRISRYLDGRRLIWLAYGGCGFVVVANVYGSIVRYYREKDMPADELEKLNDERLSRLLDNAKYGNNIKIPFVNMRASLTEPEAEQSPFQTKVQYLKSFLRRMFPRAKFSSESPTSTDE